MRFTLSEIDQVVCVSHCSKENLVLRAQLDPFKVSVHPYAYCTILCCCYPAVTLCYKVMVI
jgi:hypothetical protein